MNTGERPVGDGPPQRTTITLPPALATRLRAAAEASARSVSAIVREALQEYFDRQAPAPLPSFTGAGASGRGDVSERAEELIERMFASRRKL
jgi:hypothetical protein